MQIKNYQQKALDQLHIWFDELKKAHLQSGKTIKVLTDQNLKLPKEIKNYPLLAWNNLKEKKLVPAILENGNKKIPEYISRTGTSGEPIPHVCLKVPTGGGKTLLGVTAFECMKQDTGFILWIVPTKAIYEQTLKAFKTREHPYRQILENISSGKIKLLQKDERFTKQDTENHLCLMMLMLPSANRQKNRDFLKIFRDSSGYKSFFPEEDDWTANQELSKKHPDLEKNNSGDWVKHSLINVLKLIRPTVILDEAHKAYGTNNESNKEFVKSVNRLNPRFVLELSATPKLGISNILINISGTELKAEEMIKLPVEIHSFTNSDWKYTLAETQKRLNELEKKAEKLHTKENRYIRPMAVIRVEQTGKAQIGKGRIHAEDAKKYLIKHLSVLENQIKIQSSEEKGLAGENLMSEASQVRWVITKDALKEGWDCSFAYILALLDNTRANTAITQMMGRVMRQPQAHRVMGNDSLNRCYIYCFNKDVGEAVQKVKESLEREGLTGIGNFVRGYDGRDDETKEITVKRRNKYKKCKIFLPQVLHRKGKRWHPIDYDCDILGELNWKDIDGGESVNLDDKNIIQEVKATLDLQGEEEITTEILDTNENLTIDYFVRRLSDIIPNPWQATRIANNFLQKHRIQGHNAVKLLNNRIHLSEVLKKRVKKEIDIKAELVFRDKVGKDEISFRLETDDQLNYEMEHSFSVFVSKKERTLQGKHGKDIQLSLFEPVFESEFDTQLEKDAAIYLDESNAIYWWHRIAARQAYSLQGWKRHKVYPDFLAYRKNDNRLFIIELKGDQFRGNPDTEYKKNLFRKLEDTYQSAYDRGEMKINSPSAVLRMLFEDTWRPDLGILIKKKS